MRQLYFEYQKICREITLKKVFKDAVNPLMTLGATVLPGHAQGSLTRFRNQLAGLVQDMEAYADVAELDLAKMNRLVKENLHRSTGNLLAGYDASKNDKLDNFIRYCNRQLSTSLSITGQLRAFYESNGPWEKLTSEKMPYRALVNAMYSIGRDHARKETRSYKIISANYNWTMKQLYFEYQKICPEITLKKVFKDAVNPLSYHA